MNESPAGVELASEGYTFFQGPGEAVLIKNGAKAELGSPSTAGKKGVAPTEGAEH